MKIDVFVKSRHSGLSGIGCFFNVLEKKDSGQAGMTTFNELVNSFHSFKHITHYASRIALLICCFASGHQRIFFYGLSSHDMLMEDLSHLLLV